MKKQNSLVSVAILVMGFLLAVPALVMVSCSKDDSTSVNKGNAIDFRAAMQTRATETTTANIENFYVTAIDKNGVNYFTDVEYVKSGTTFTSTPAYYWPSDGSSLSFYAYSPQVGASAGLSGTMTINSTVQTLADFTPNAAIGDQADFVTVNATGSKADEATGVALSFEHRLAQIEIKAKNTNDGYVYKVRGVRIGQPVAKGTFDFAASAWTLDSDKTNYQSEYDTDIVLGADAVKLMGDEGNAMLLPQQLTAWKSDTDATNAAKGAYLAVKVNITTKDGALIFPAKAGEYEWVAVAIDTEWEAGRKYVYTLDFSNGSGKVDPEKPQPTDPDDPFNPGGDVSGSTIQFTVNVTDWVENSQDVDM